MFSFYFFTDLSATIVGAGIGGVICVIGGVVGVVTVACLVNKHYKRKVRKLDSI